MSWKALICCVFDHKYVGAWGTGYVWCARCDKFFGKLGEQIHTRGIYLE